MKSMNSFTRKKLAVRILCLLMVFIMPVGTGIFSIFGSGIENNNENGQSFSIGNQYILCSVDQSNGRFSVYPVGTDAAEARSFAVFQIDGEIYTFGEDAPGAYSSLSSPITDGDKITTQWTINDYVIQQNQVLIQDEANQNGWGFFIYYDVLYLGEADSSISARLLLDTQFGENDDCPIITDTGESFDSEIKFGESRSIPEYYRADTANAPAAYGVFSDGDMLFPPERAIFGRYDNIAAALTSENEYIPNNYLPLAPDGALAYYFEEIYFAADSSGEERRTQFTALYGFYGFEDITPSISIMKTDTSLLGTGGNYIINFDQMDIPFGMVIVQDSADANDEVIIQINDVTGYHLERTPVIPGAPDFGDGIAIMTHDGDDWIYLPVTQLPKNNPSDTFELYSFTMPAADVSLRITGFYDPGYFLVYYQGSEDFIFDCDLSSTFYGGNANPKANYNVGKIDQPITIRLAGTGTLTPYLAEAYYFDSYSYDNIYLNLSPVIMTSGQSGDEYTFTYSSSNGQPDRDIVFINAQNGIHRIYTTVQPYTNLIGFDLDTKLHPGLGYALDGDEITLSNFFNAFTHPNLAANPYMISFAQFDGTPILFDVLNASDIPMASNQTIYATDIIISGNYKVRVQLPQTYESGYFAGDIYILLQSNYQTLNSVRVFDATGETSPDHTNPGVEIDLNDRGNYVFNLSASFAAAGETVNFNFISASTMHKRLKEIKFISAGDGSPLTITDTFITNKSYGFTMPADGAFILLIFENDPDDMPMNITKFPANNINNRVVYDFGVRADKDDTADITHAYKGDVIYLSTPIFQNKSGENELDWSYDTANPYYVRLSGESAEISVTNEGDGWYSFVMPDGAVMIDCVASSSYSSYKYNITEFVIGYDDTDLTTGGVYVKSGGVIQPDSIAFRDEVIITTETTKRFSLKPGVTALNDYGGWTSHIDLKSPVVKVIDRATGETVAQGPGTVGVQFYMTRGDIDIEVTWSPIACPVLSVSNPYPDKVKVTYNYQNSLGGSSYRVKLVSTDYAYIYGLTASGGVTITEGNKSPFVGAYMAEYDLFLTQDTQVLVTRNVSLPAFPEITSVAQVTVKTSEDPWLHITGKNLVAPNVTYRTTMYYNDGTPPSVLTSVNAGDIMLPLSGKNNNSDARFLIKNAVSNSLGGDIRRAQRVKIEAYISNGSYGYQPCILYEGDVTIINDNMAVYGNYRYVGVAQNKSNGKFAVISGNYINNLYEEARRANAELLTVYSSFDGFDFDKSGGKFTLKFGSNTAIVQIGNLVTASVRPNGSLTISCGGVESSVTGSFISVVVCSEVNVEGVNAELSSPTTTFFKPSAIDKKFNINYSDPGNKGYITEYDINFRNINKNVVTLEWFSNVNKIGKVSAVLGMAFELYDVALFDDALVFGGEVTVDIPVINSNEDALIEITAEQLKYAYNNNNKFGFEGMIASGSINTPQMLAMMKMKFDGYADVNTLATPKYIKCGAEINIIVGSAEAEVSLVTRASDGKWIPDALYLYIESGKGIPIVPEVLEITGGGASVRNIADTVNKNYRVIAPLRVGLIGSIQVIDLITIKGTGEFGVGYFSARSTTGVDLKAIAFDIIESLGWSLGMYELNNYVVPDKKNTVWTDAYMYAASGLGRYKVVPGFEFLYGIATVDFGIVTKDFGNFNDRYIFFNAEGNMKFQIPQFKLVGISYGPYTLFGINAKITERYVKASATLLGIIKVSLNFDYRGDSKPQIGISMASFGFNPTVSNEIPLYDDAGNYIGTATIGGNMSYICSSEQSFVPFAMPVSYGIMALGASLQPATISVSADGTTHTINVNAVSPKTVAVQVNLPPSEFTVYSPDGKPYPLNTLSAEQNIEMFADDAQSGGLNALLATDEEGNINGCIFELPDIGVWQIVANQKFISQLFSVDIPPSFIFDTCDMNNGIYKIIPEAVPVEDLILELRCEKLDANGLKECGYSLGTAGINGSVALDGVDFPAVFPGAKNMFAGLPSGDYKVYMDLIRPDNTNPAGIYGLASNDELLCRQYYPQIFTHKNLNEPAAVTGLSIASGANGCLNVNWNESFGMSRYILKVYEEKIIEGQILYSPAMVALDTADPSTGETATSFVEAEYSVGSEYGANGNFAVSLSGLSAGVKYVVDVIPVKSSTVNSPDVGDITFEITGEAARSNAATIREPNFPIINIANAVRGDTGGYILNGGIGGVDFIISTDQLCDITLTETSMSGGSYTETVLYTVYNGNQMTYSIPYDNDNPSRTFLVTAVNSYGDTTEYGVLTNTNVITPPLTLDGMEAGKIPEIYADSSGNFTLSGRTFPNLTVAARETVENGISISSEANENGEYNINGSLGAKTEASLLLQVRNEFGNQSVIQVNVLRDENTGSLVIKKTLSGNNVDTAKYFNFTVTFSDGGTYGGLASGSDIALKGGQSKTIQGIPHGIVYTVVEVEANRDGYATTSTGASGTISATQSIAEFVNSKNGDNNGGDLIPTTTAKSDSNENTIEPMGGETTTAAATTDKTTTDKEKNSPTEETIGTTTATSVNNDNYDNYIEIPTGSIITTETMDSTQPTGDSGSSGETAGEKSDDAVIVYYKGQIVPSGTIIIADIGDPLVIRITKPFNKFLTLFADGAELVRDVEYDAAEGSTILTVYPETLAKLGKGNHKFTAVFTDEDIDILVNLISTSDRTGADNPQTGDGSLYLIFGLLVLTIAGAVVFKRKVK